MSNLWNSCNSANSFTYDFIEFSKHNIEKTKSYYLNLVNVNDYKILYNNYNKPIYELDGRALFYYKE